MAKLECLNCGKVQTVMHKADFVPCDCGANLAASTLQSIEEISYLANEVRQDIEQKSNTQTYSKFRVEF